MYSYAIRAVSATWENEMILVTSIRPAEEFLLGQDMIQRADNPPIIETSAPIQGRLSVIVRCCEVCFVKAASSMCWLSSNVSSVVCTAVFMYL